jgi:hypothetical protein
MVLVLNESHYITRGERQIMPGSLNILLAEHGVSGKSDHSVDPAVYAIFSLGTLSSVPDHFT